MSNPATPLPVVVLISGRGSNLQSIIDAIASSELPVDIRAVISNRPNAAGLQRATQAGIATEIIDHTSYEDRATFDQALQTCIDRYQPALVVLAGFMRILTPGFVAHYQGRLLNIHPSLLPEFPGLNTHQRVLAAGNREHGASVHFVTDAMDGGPVVLQARLAIQDHDTAETLAARVLEQEHRMLPLIIRWFAEQRLVMNNSGQVVFDGAILAQPRTLTEEVDKTC